MTVIEEDGLYLTAYFIDLNRTEIDEQEKKRRGKDPLFATRSRLSLVKEFISQLNNEDWVQVQSISKDLSTQINVVRSALLLLGFRRTQLNKIGRVRKVF